MRAQVLANAVGDYLRIVCPYDTGNLHNSITVKHIGKGTWEVSIPAERVPYMVYTNEPWLSPKWHGRKNPNQYWFNDAFVAVAEMIAYMVGGTIKEEVLPPIGATDLAKRLDRRKKTKTRRKRK